LTTRVVIVDDSATARESLSRALRGAEGFEVVGAASHAAEALALVERLRPSIVTIDVCLGAEDGVELARRMMDRRPVPILIVTGFDPGDPGLAFRAIQAGALEVLPKLPAATRPEYPHERQRLLRTLAALSAVPLVTRHARAAPGPPSPPPRRLPPGRGELVVVGASTGGPPVLQAILGALPRPFPVPIVIVQHIADGFAETLAEWLGHATGHDMRVCNEPRCLEPGVVYLAPGRSHVRVTSARALALVDEPPRHYQKPSIDVLFESVAASSFGPVTVGVLLTGMGRDGAAGLARLAAGGAVAIVQSPESCVIDSMPQSALAMGVAAAELDPAAIARTLPVLVKS
jgi:two-component system, chemotaxis family, protein-glutamate methylesterase/glutaminase